MNKIIQVVTGIARSSSFRCCESNRNIAKGEVFHLFVVEDCPKTYYYALCNSAYWFRRFLIEKYIPKYCSHAQIEWEGMDDFIDDCPSIIRYMWVAVYAGLGLVHTHKSLVNYRCDACADEDNICHYCKDIPEMLGDFLKDQQ